MLRKALSTVTRRVCARMFAPTHAAQQSAYPWVCTIGTPSSSASEHTWRAHASFANTRAFTTPTLGGHDEDPITADTTSTSETPNTRKDLYMMFTCGRCDTRATRGFSRQAYENGVVIVTCPGCNSKHVVADRMGWFGEPGSVEDFIAQKTEHGEGAAVDQTTLTVTRGSLSMKEGDEDGTLEINQEELKAWLKTFAPASASSSEKK